MAKARTHVVIGDGATAAALATRAPLRSGDRLIVLGPDVAQLGRGLAYRDHAAGDPWRHAYLLNSPNESVDRRFAAWFAANWDVLRPEIARHQPRWLAFGAAHIAARDLGALFAPRAIFGHWVTLETKAGLHALGDRGVGIDLRPATVRKVAPAAQGFEVVLASGDSLFADSVDVATGGAGTLPFRGAGGPASFPGLYGWEHRIAQRVSPGTLVTCVGGNAAMLDVLRFLQCLLDDGDIRLRVINRGPVPEPLVLHRPRRPAVSPTLSGPFASAAEVLAALDADIAGFRSAGADMAQLRGGFSPWFDSLDLNTLLPDRSEQRTLARQLEPRFRRGTHDSIADYTRLKAAGRIEEVMGTVQAIDAPGAQDAEVTYVANGAPHRVRSPRNHATGRWPVFLCLKEASHDRPRSPRPPLTAA
jgi:uncharacterized NAD(P)/FAD-binding protein YdhS